MRAIAGSVAAPGSRLVPRRGGFGTIGWVGATIVGVFIFVGAAGPTLAPYGANQFVAPTLESPSLHHLLGTNQIGQDLVSQLLVGARVSLLVSFMAGAGSVAAGAVVGIVAGWAGSWIDQVLMRLTDIALALPRLPLLILVAAYAGRSVTTLSLVIAALFWPGTARILRAQVRSLRRRDHLRAAIGFGSTPRQVVARHVLPELVPVMAASFVAAAGRAVLIQAGLAFLGLSDPSRISWGTILASAFNAGGIFFTETWIRWLLPPIAAIVMVLLGLTFLGMAIEQRFNPRLARHAAAPSSNSF